MLAQIYMSVCCHRLQDDEERGLLAAEDVEAGSLFSAVLIKANHINTLVALRSWHILHVECFITIALENK